VRKLTLIEACCAPLAKPVSEASARELERIFRALADRHRVKILSLLVRGGDEAICVCDFVSVLGLSQPTVSYHLKQLTDVGLLLREKRGSFAYFRLAPNALAHLRGLLAEGTATAAEDEAGPAAG
jgi:ArsR family transcriptional regulator